VQDACGPGQRGAVKVLHTQRCHPGRHITCDWGPRPRAVHVGNQQQGRCNRLHRAAHASASVRAIVRSTNLVPLTHELNALCVEAEGMVENQKAAMMAAAAEGGKLLSRVTELLAKKDVAMGDLLQLMEPVKGQDEKVDECSDGIEAMQTDLDKQFKALRERLDAMTSLAAALPAEGAEAAGRSAAQPKQAEAEHKITATRTASGAAQAPGGDNQLDRRERDEIADLRAKLQSVTMREKERLEALQSQLEAARHELSECRSGRRIEQSNLVAAESQATQLRTALACAEEDMKALRDALDQELLRGHRLQSRLMELDHKLQSQSLREPFEGAPKNNKAHGTAGMSRTGSGSTAVAPSLEDVAFDDYLSSLRKDGGGGRGKARPASAKQGKSGGARAAGDKQRPVSAGGNAGSQKDDGHVWWGRDGERKGREYPGGSSAMDIVISNRQASVPTDPLRQEERLKRAPPAPSASSTHTTNVSATSVLGANSTTLPSFPKLGSLGGGTEGSPPLARSQSSGVSDASSLGYLRSNVVSGHVTKTSHLELKVEYCGRKSFSVRHKVSLSLSLSLSL
jgi:hypothetical protein